MGSVSLQTRQSKRSILMIVTNATEILETIVIRDEEIAITIGATTTGAEVVTTTVTRILVAHST